MSECQSPIPSDSGLCLQIDSWMRTVETVGRQYAFIKFGKSDITYPLHGAFLVHDATCDGNCPLIQLLTADRVIQRKRRDYSDPTSTVNVKKLNDDLNSIHNIMRKTIDDVLDRCASRSLLHPVRSFTQNV